LLDEILSVEEVGVYKPHPKVYQLAIDRLGIPASGIAFQSSNAWYGCPDREITSLAELTALVGA
jgi:2-haloacid dehalogenase